MQLVSITLLFIVTIELGPSLLYAHPTWPNEPPNSIPLIDCAFNQLDCDGQLWDVYKSGSIAQDPTAPFSPPGVGRASLFYPNTQGGIELVYFKRAPLREIYAGFWFKVNEGWQQNSVGANKVFFLRAVNDLQGGTQTNGNWAIAGYGNPMQLVWSHNTGTLDNSHACSQDLGLVCYSNMGSGNIYVGRWHRIEAYVRASRCPICRDAIVRWWVDGQLAGNYTNLNYGTKVVNEWVWAQTWDGHGNSLGRTQDVHQFIDHLHISAPNCPLPCDATSRPAPPPSPKDGRPDAPTDVHVTVRP
jgi:hypothetical protein